MSRTEAMFVGRPTWPYCSTFRIFYLIMALGGRYAVAHQMYTITQDISQNPS